MAKSDFTVVYIDPDRRALFVDELPGEDGRFGAWSQKEGAAPRKLVTGYIRKEGYATLEEAQAALDLHISNSYNRRGLYRYDILVNGKAVTRDEFYAIKRGEIAAPSITPKAAIITLQNIEYRISLHLRGAYQELLSVGHCLNEAKDSGLVAHGEWEEWVRRNAGMSERQAQRLMQAARGATAGSALAKLPVSKITSILTLPEPEREPMAQRATDENLSLRQLEEEIKKAKAAQKAAEDKLQSERSDHETIISLRDARNRSRLSEIDRLTEELKLVREQPAGDGGISDEAKAEIEKLEKRLAQAQADIEAAEAYAEAQAEKRQAAEREMLALRSEAARGSDIRDGAAFSAHDLTTAVRAFIGVAGVIPHMGGSFAAMPEAERQVYVQYVEMVAAWVDGARRALDVIGVAYQAE